MTCWALPLLYVMVNPELHAYWEQAPTYVISTANKLMKRDMGWGMSSGMKGVGVTMVKNYWHGIFIKYFLMIYITHFVIPISWIKKPSLRKFTRSPMQMFFLPRSLSFCLIMLI